jgi:hypothetical protein
MVRMEVGGYGGGAPQDEIVATTFGVPGQAAHLGHGYPPPGPAGRDQLPDQALDPDAMFDEQFDKQVRRLRAERDRLKALPAEPDRWDEQPTGDLYVGIYQALPLRTRRVTEVSVIQGDVRGTAHLG